MNCMTNANFNNYIKFEVAIVEKNDEFVEKFKYFEKVLVDNE